MNYLKLALETITGRGISDYAFITSKSFLELAKSLADKSIPFHFNEIDINKDINQFKNGFYLVCENDFIRYNGHFYEGVNRLYSKREVSKIMNSSDVVFVK